VLGAGVIAAGWFLGVSPALAGQAVADSMRKDTVAQNDAIAASIAVLKDQKKDLPAYEKRAEELEQAIPADVEAADFIRSLNDLATATNVTISQITMGDAVPYATPAGEVADPDKAPNPVTDSRVTPDNFLLIPVSISVSGGWDEVLAFSHGVQAGTRLMLVTGVDTAADESGTTFNTQLSGAMYVLVRPPAPAAVAGGDATSTEG